MRSKDSSYHADSNNTNHRHHHRHCHHNHSLDYSPCPQTPYNDVPSAVPCMPPYYPCSCPPRTANPGYSAPSNSYFFATTQGATLTTTPTFITFTPQAQSSNIKGTSPTITFAKDGTYLVQLIAPITTTANYTGTATVSIGTNISGAITTVAPRSYSSTTLTAGLTQLPLIFSAIVTVSNIYATSAPTTLSYSINLSTAPTTGSVSLAGSTIVAHRLA